MALDEQRAKRKKRIRKNVNGSTERPRLSVFRSSKHIYAQVIDDARGVTLASVSTLSKDVRGDTGEKNKSDCAKLVGLALAQACKAKGVSRVVFDRNGYIYHGRVKALADAAREGGLDF
jgi:large subunit ribosomal protein L18